MNHPLRLRLWLSRHVQNGLSLVKTEFWDEATPFVSPPTSVVTDRRFDAAGRAFPWNNGSRALTILFLRHFAPRGSRFRLDSKLSTLAKALVEILGDPCDASQQQTWIQRIFNRPEWEPNTALAYALFNRGCNTHKEEYWCSLGSLWTEATLEVFLEGGPQPSNDYARLADELEGHIASDATLDVLVLNERQHRYCSVREQNVLPLKTDSHVQICATVQPEAFLYIVWLTTENRVLPLYPWKSGRWDELPNDGKQSVVKLPTDRIDWRIEGEKGWETILLLVRQSPLSKEMRVKLPEEFNSLLRTFSQRTTVRSPATARWFAANGEVKVIGRGPDLSILRRPSHPIDSFHMRLCSFFSTQFDLIRGVSVVNIGNEKIHAHNPPS